MTENGSSGDKRWCSIRGCPFKPWNKASFHLFPMDKNLREKWRNACRIEKLITPCMHICSNHFTKDCFFPPRNVEDDTSEKPKRVRLKQGSIPSQNLPKVLSSPALLTSQVENVHHNRKPSHLGNKIANKRAYMEMSGPENEAEGVSGGKRSPHTTGVTTECKSSSSDAVKSLEFSEEQRCEHGVHFDDEDSEHGVPLSDEDSDSSVFQDHQDEKKLLAGILSELSNIPFSREEKRICFQKVTQICGIPKGSRSFVQNLQHDLELKAFTGIRYELLDSFAEAVLPYEDQFTTHTCPIKERVVLTLCKLRLNLSFKGLGLLFSINKQTCKTIFKETVQILQTVLAGAVYWPTKESVLKTMPSSCYEFRHTRVILDIIEIETEKPNCLQCSSSLHSQSKGSKIVKVLTGVAPSGLVTFISKPYGGRVSNETILENSNLLDLLVKGEDALMVNDRFDGIDKECTRRGLVIIQPPSLSNEKLLSPEDALRSMKISSAKAYVTEAMQRVKKFRILSSVLEQSFIPCVNSILVVVAATVNLCNGKHM